MEANYGYDSFGFPDSETSASKICKLQDRIAVLTRALELACESRANYAKRLFGDSYSDADHFMSPDEFIKQAEAERGEK